MSEKQHIRYRCEPVCVRRGGKKLPEHDDILAATPGEAAAAACRAHGWVIARVNNAPPTAEEWAAMSPRPPEDDNAFPRMGKKARNYDYRGVKVEWNGSRYMPTDPRIARRDGYAESDIPAPKKRRPSFRAYLASRSTDPE